MTRNLLRAGLAARRDEYRKVDAQVDGAKLIDDFMVQLEELWAHEDDAEIGLAEAEAVTGYSGRTLRRKVATGALRASKRGNRLYFRAADLPHRRGSLDRPPVGSYDPIADARQVAARRSHGESSHDASQAP